MRPNLKARVERLESESGSVAQKPWIRIIVDGETEAEAYERVTGSPYSADPDALSHNVIFRVII